MHQDDDDVFEPAQALSSAGQAVLLPLDPPPGPGPDWTAAGVIAALGPLTTPERCSRLSETLRSRIQSVTVLFDHPHDPHNGSAVLRSCDAFGVQRVHIVSADEPFTASRMVAKGSDRWVDIIHHESPTVAARTLHDEGFQILVTHPKGQLEPSDLAQLPKVALILGNERDGVSEELTRLSDGTVRIPMRGFVESLNVSVTAGILVQAACSGRSGDLSETQRENIYARWLRKSVPRADEVLAALEPC
jgi:tRNA (guanosine-2'-O-)-methyltransferase